MDNIHRLSQEFRARHNETALFVMPCAWDAFSAILFERAGFPCVGTTSGGVNWIRGRKDYIYNTPAQEMLDAYGDIADATSLPVSGDLENGYGESPEAVADTIRGAIDAGMVGGSIEDQKIVPTDDEFTNGVLFSRDDAIERIKYARQAADASGIDFTLTARCEVYYTGSDNCLGIAIDRLNAYRQAGADCLFVPGLNDLDLLSQLIKEIDGPVSFGMGATPEPITLRMLEDIGVRRVSTGGGITRAVFTAIQHIAQELSVDGTATYLDGIMSEADINLILDQRISLLKS